MPKAILEPGSPSVPPDQPAHRPFPEVAGAIRAQAERILEDWRSRTLISMPELGELSVSEFKNGISRILAAMADVLESNDPPDLRRLMQAAPEHGFQRFMHEYDLSDLFAEERVLRRVIVSRVEEGLARRCSAEEAAALHGMIDIMLQQGVLALVQEQRQELRQGAEAQLKHLSFLSHDLGNTFFAMTCNLNSIEHELSKLPQMSAAAKRVGASLAIIKRTRQGMRRLLEHERLRSTQAGPGAARVRLLDVVAPIVTTVEADGEGPRITVDVSPDAVALTNGDLLTIILQNLIGNAVKHGVKAVDGGGVDAGVKRDVGGGVGGGAGGGEVGAGIRVEAEREAGKADCWVVSVVDDGPGIPAAELDRLFKAFEGPPRTGGEAPDAGFGLGLAIASEAARLLGGTIQVRTGVGRGSRFSIRVPAAP